MELIFTKTLLNNIYTVETKTTLFDANDTLLFTEFSEPLINVGGVMLDLDGTTQLVLLPDNFRKVKSGFPFTMSFSDTQFLGKGEKVANAWITALNTRITSAIVAMRAKFDNFTGEQTFTI